METTSFLDTIELRQNETEPLADNHGTEDTSKLLDGRSRAWRTRLSGWRGGVAACIAIVSFVLLLNVVLAIVAATTWNTKDGISTAYMGDCSVASKATTVLHLIINLLSSGLLGASNYCMQRVVAPTRKEIDNAHVKRKWLDIGIPSVRNLTSISKGRTLLWVLLSLSSVPLHFVYNSVVFETIAANEVTFAIVGPGFLTNPSSWSFNQTLPDSSSEYLVYNSTWDNYVTRLQRKLLDDNYLDPTKFHNLTSDECASTYNGDFITTGDCYAIPTPTYLERYRIDDQNSYYRSFNSSGQFDVGSFHTNSMMEFSYCLSEVVPSKCEVQVSRIILWIVIACNLSKLLLMAMMLWYLDDDTIITIGDAIQSFLRYPDATTEDCCLMSSEKKRLKIWKLPQLRGSQYYKSRKRQPWRASCSRRRWVTSLLLYAAALVATGVLFSIVQRQSLNTAGKNGFGKVNTSFLIDIDMPFSDSIIPYVLLANLPQAVASFIYLTYNGIFTCMLANREWSQFCVKRAPLRVTVPSPGQRSTHFLQLPYTFSIPLLIGGVLLHWFISQSIFLARIAMYKDGVLVEMKDRLGSYQHMTKASGEIFTGLGYSDSALIASLTWGSIIVLVVISVANFNTYPKGIPVGGTNSAVISAACHSKYEEGVEAHESKDNDIVNQPLKWGVTIRGGRNRIGHCCFSSEEVEGPVAGHLYAGASCRIRDIQP